MSAKVPLEIDNSYKLFVEDLDDVLYHLHYAKSRAMKVDWDKTSHKRADVFNRLNQIEDVLTKQLKTHRL